MRYGGSAGGAGGAGGGGAGGSSSGANVVGGNNEMLGVRKSPLNSSIGSRVSSLNNSHRFDICFDFFFLTMP